MLKLRKIELTGFKSFSDRTMLSLGGQGITCIVGPNGCGKSNIVDAITWVLGEQSHKTLRAERMADCISNGSATRAPVGMAEVSLTLVDPELAEAAQKILSRSEQDPAQAEAGVEDASLESQGPAEDPPVDAAPADLPGRPGGRRKRQAATPKLSPGEVVVTRRLYRSGQSEYLINGRAARLRDIQELFMEMGLGPNSYAIIEQGRIGQILASRPAERRAILEEAAGVSKFKTKKRLAEAKLESSKLNLSRINDILTEVAKRLEALKRQASRARRYAEMREESRGLLASVLGAKWGRMRADAERVSLELARLREDEARRASELVGLEAEQQRLESRAYELENELRENQNRQNQTALETDRTRNRLSYNRQQDEQLESQIGQLDSQAAEAAERARAAGERQDAQRETLDALRERKAAIEEAANALAERVGAIENDERIQLQRRDEAAASAKRLAEEISRAQVESAQAGEALRHHGEALAQQEQALARLDASCQNQSALLSAVEERSNQALCRAQAAGDHLAEIQARLTERRREQIAAIADTTGSREQLAASRARQVSLEEILRERAYTGATIQKLLGLNGDGERHGFRTTGLLSDYAEVEPQFEAAVEQFLLDELDYVVVESFDSARAAIGLLHGEIGGRAAFFVDSVGSLPVAAEPESPIASTPGVVAPMDRLVNFRRPLGEAAKAFLPRLRSAFLVETAAAAESLAQAHPHKHFVTADGTWYHGRVVSGGRPGEAGPLSLKRELRQIEAETLRIETQLAERETTLESLEAQIGELSTAAEQARIEALAAEKSASAAAQEREHAQAELERVAAELRDCRAQVDRWRSERDAAAARAQAAQQCIDAAAGAREAAEGAIASCAAQLTRLRDDLAAERERLATGRAELAGITERTSAAEAVVQALTAEFEEFSARAAQFGRDRAALAERRSQLAADSVAAQAELDKLGRSAAEIQEHGRRLEQEFRGSRSRALEIAETLRSARQQLDESREQRGRVEVESVRMQAEIEHLCQASQSELGVGPEQIAAPPVLLSPEELSATETRYHEIKQRLDSMGPINMMALEEYKECDERAVFLTRERDDLLGSIADTEQAIAELDKASRERFAQAFAEINRNFTEAFISLFGGGTAEMRQDEPDSSGEQGLVIVAQPPGKRLQNVMLLSGGEKALTALALLIAIFRFQPSPFCVLDEVDAPLDESNVVRFNRMLADMSGETQFLVVTHNRRTMEMGSALYGVTMQEPGVSRIVSVRWEQSRSDAA
ncbi:MAG TPA: chromosome segregation protein SMC [Patescibacteria group bacterium]|nr:chromosome segregation protein SMC [Patescibacteria group bacterium]